MQKKKIVILCGPTRTSTTSLFRFFSDFPEFNVSKVKETNSLSSHNNFKNGAIDFDSYFDMFSYRGGEVYLEASPLYFMFGQHLASLIKRANDSGKYDIKVLITLRNPYDRFLSLYKHIITKRSLSEDFDKSNFFEENLAKALLKDVKPDDIHQELNSFSLYESCYSKICRDWFDVLGKDTVRVAFYESVSSSSDFNSICNAFFSWIGISKKGDFSFPYENKSQPVKRKGLHSFALSVNDFLEPFLNNFPVVRSFLRFFYYKINSSSGEIDFPSQYKEKVIKILSNGNEGLGYDLRDYLLVDDVPSWVDDTIK